MAETCGSSGNDSYLGCLYRKPTIYLFSVLMKQFLIYVALLLGMTIIFMVAFDAIYTTAFTKGIPRSKLQYALQKENVTYDYVFFGSSRTEFHVDCDLVERLTGKSCLNYGISGTTLFDTYALLELLQSQGVTIKNAFVQVDYLFNDVEYSPKFRAQLLPYHNESKLGSVLDDYDYSFWNEYIPFYSFIENGHVTGFREIFNLIRGARPATNFDNGFIPKFGKHDNIVRALPDRIIGTNESIDAMKKLFQEKNISAYFFTAPICNTAIGRDYIDKLKIKIPELHNYVSVYDDNFDYYFDCGHLNDTGAQDFTRRLIEDLILN
jgi:hypothetical protein